ncbi:MAG: hypothetical protein JRH20_15290, partial [Deltaproteobacteria bacterium]|nr:hypothetical protein [Deltaproteobacteria bacterium]
MVSRWSELPVAAHLLVTGSVTADGLIGAVSGLAKKAASAFRERPLLEKLVVPKEGSENLQDPRIVRVSTIAELIASVFGQDALTATEANRADIEGLVRKGIDLYEKHNNFAAAETLFEAALAAIAVQREGGERTFRQEEFVVLWRLGSSLIHRGAVERSTELFARADALGAQLWDEQAIAPREFLGYRATRAVLLRDSYQYEKAEATLHETLKLQRSLRQGKRQLAKTLGNLGELLSFRGKFQQAERALVEAKDYLEASYREELPRAHC